MGCLRKCTLAGQAPKATWGVHHSPQNVLQASQSRLALANWVKVYPGSGTILQGQKRSWRPNLTVTQKKSFSLHQVWLCQGSINGSLSGQIGLKKKKKKAWGRSWKKTTNVSRWVGWSFDRKTTAEQRNVWSPCVAFPGPMLTCPVSVVNKVPCVEFDSRDMREKDFGVMLFTLCLSGGKDLINVDDGSVSVC